MKSVPHPSRLFTTRSAAALWASCFLFFLIYSAPHRVHHFFEQFPQAHHPDGDHKHSGTSKENDSNCAFQVSASRCHLGLAWQITPASLPVFIQALTVFHATDSGLNFLPTGFQIRAPPVA
jgi:hypothetical protein